MSEIKTSMLSNGKCIVYEGNGNARKASDEERISHLASLLPQSYKGEELRQVKFDSSDGCVYGKYATRQVKKLIVAEKTEPVDGTQKTKETDVPRNKSKAAPETDSISKDRPDVKNPDEVRTKEYQRGKGGEDLHSDTVPRSKGNSGLEGRESTTFEAEEADKATSGNPDSYVQDFTPAKDPEKAGSEMNHAAQRDVKFKSESEMYQNLTTAGKLPPWLENKDEDEDEDKKDKGDKKDKSDKKDEKDDDKKDNKKKSKKPPWLDGKSGKGEDDDDDDSDKKASSENDLKTALNKKEAEINSYRVKEARTKTAISYALALLRLNPKKYANAETFNEIIDKTVEKMSVEAIETAIEELKTVEAEKQNITKQIQTSAASVEEDSDPSGLSTSIVIAEQERFKKQASTNDLKEILMSGTMLGQKMDEFANYVPSEPR